MILQESLSRAGKGACMLPNDSEIAAKSLAKLWPHRQHESNYVKNLLCSLGMHRWTRLELGGLIPEKEKSVQFCRWCPKLKLDGVTYGD